MKTYFNFILPLSIFCLCIFFGINCVKPDSKILTGLDILENSDFGFLKEKRVGLITNQTGLNQNGIQNVNLFLASPNVQLKAVFSPEHGFEGMVQAGEKINSISNSPSGIPYYSLYGKTRKPSKEMLQGLDALVFDIQDIGIRSYTYNSTMGLAMEAAGEMGIEFIVLDRPNPLGGEKIEGNILNREFSSFIGMYPIPYIHGLTTCELASLINKKGWVKSSCKLTVVNMENWQRKMIWEDTKLEWIAPSPNVPTSITPQYMAATGILGELGVFSIGIGTEKPFEFIGAPWINKIEMAEKMNHLKLSGVSFNPITFSPTKGLFQDEEVNVIQLHISNFEQAELLKIQFYFMVAHDELYPNKNPFKLATKSQLNMFDNALGTDQFRLVFSDDFNINYIEYFLKKIDSNFIEMKKQAHLYE